MLRSSQDLDLPKLTRSIGFFGPEGAPATFGDTLRATMTETLADYAFQADSVPLAPVDARLQAFLDRYLGRMGIEAPRLPGRTLSLNRWGLARMLSLPRSTGSACEDNAAPIEKTPWPSSFSATPRFLTAVLGHSFWF